MRTRAWTAWRGSLLGLMALLVLGGPGAVPAATLRWKFRPGETLHYVMEQTTETAEEAGPQKIKTTLTQTTDMSWAINHVQPGGVADVTYTIDRLRTKIESPFGTFEYDTKDVKAPQGLIGASIVPLFKALVGAPFRFKISPQGELSDVKVPEQLIKTLRESGPAAGSSMFSEEGLKNMIVESSLALPRDDLAKGKTWTRQVKIPSPFGDTTLEKTYTFQGPDPAAGPNVDRIDLVTKVDLPPQREGAPPVTVKDQVRKGTFYFDNAAGRVIRSQLIESLDTAATIPTGRKDENGKPLNVEVVQRKNATTNMRLEPGGAAGAPR